MMKLVFFGIFVVLARHANANCRDLTLDNCVRETKPFETAKDLPDAATCQALCNVFKPQCAFFVFNKEHRFCEMFDFNLQMYKDSCRILSLTPDVEISECYNSTDASLADPCLNFIEENCKYDADILDEDFEVDNVEKCRQAASIKKAAYFVHNEDEKNCALYSSTERSCDLIFGPPTPDYDAVLCGDEKPPKSCPEGWLDSPDGCFYFATDAEASTWDEAVGYCQELGGYLAEVLNDETQRLLVEQATALGTSTNWWLGATDQASEGKWIWVKNADPLEFSAWSQNEPDDAGHNEDCLHLLVDHGYHWNDFICDENSLRGRPNKPICQKRF